MNDGMERVEYDSIESLFVHEYQHLKYDYIPELEYVKDNWKNRAKKAEESLEYLKQFFHLADYPGDGVCIRFESLEGHTIDDAYHEKEFIKIVQILDLKREEDDV